MKNNRATLEVIAQNVEEAIEKGLSDLGLPRDAVEIDILDEGGSGILGFGSRQARVRISILGEGEDQDQEETQTPVKEANPDETLNMVEEIVSELLDKMNLEATVEARYGEKIDNLPHTPILVDISGNDLSILIGRRAKTLNALQYITRLILGKELEHGTPLSIDVEGYRERREQQVRHLARRVADQVADTKREQALEPMPPNERRFAHLELQDDPQVYTESVGQEPYRKVVIHPGE